MENAYDVHWVKLRIQNCILEVIAVKLKYMHLKNILQGTLENKK